MNFENFMSRVILSSRYGICDNNNVGHEYIKRSFLFNKRFMKGFFYISMITKFGLANMPLSK
jgi:hypothetical protein